MKSINNDISVRKQFRNKADVTGIHVCRNRFDLISLILAVLILIFMSLMKKMDKDE